MESSSLDFWAILETLTEHNVEFIVIGGVCAFLHGVPVVTIDLDIVPRRSPDNLACLLTALEEMDAYYREAPSRRLRPKIAWLEGPGHSLLVTRFGNLDVLGTTTEDRGYEELHAHSTEMTLRVGLTIRVIDLPMLIQLKEEANREKDRLHLPILRKTLLEQQRLDSNDSRPSS